MQVPFPPSFQLARGVPPFFSFFFSQLSSLHSDSGTTKRESEPTSRRAYVFLAPSMADPSLPLWLELIFVRVWTHTRTTLTSRSARGIEARDTLFRRKDS